MTEKSMYTREVDCKDGADVAKAVMTLVNTFGREHIGPFALEVTNDHRTLQQSAMELFLETIMLYAHQFDNGYFDMRNEASCRLALNIRGMLEAENIVFKEKDGTYSRVILPCV